jgi:hypothetical protein
MGSGKVLVIHRQNCDCSTLKSVLSRERYEVIDAPLDLGKVPIGIDDCCLILLDSLAAEPATLEVHPAKVLSESLAGALRSASTRSRRSVRRKSLQMRRQRRPSLRAIELGDKTVLLSARVVRGGLGDVRLTRFEYCILNDLLAHVNQTVPSVRLVHRLWPSDPTKGVHSLRAFIKNLRKKIEPDPANPQFIVTDLAIGYRFRLLASGRDQ